jgi:hypothetical protein
MLQSVLQLAPLPKGVQMTAPFDAHNQAELHRQLKL